MNSGAACDENLSLLQSKSLGEMEPSADSPTHRLGGRCYLLAESIPDAVGQTPTGNLPLEPVTLYNMVAGSKGVHPDRKLSKSLHDF